MEHLIITWTPIIVSVVALCLSISRNSKSDRQVDTDELKKRVEADTKVNMKLDEISRNVGDIKNEIRGIRQEVQAMDGRIVKLESSTKSLHKRIDTMEQRLNLHEE